MVPSTKVRYNPGISFVTKLQVEVHTNDSLCHNIPRPYKISGVARGRLFYIHNMEKVATPRLLEDEKDSIYMTDILSVVGAILEKDKHLAQGDHMMELMVSMLTNQLIQ